ncbi:MAG: hypothetical protein JXA99_14395 [Candidatus Lokiarchaeota archaeon]|nr:hypothetical protein [Candidatus Lokiarchaeota archaeon]
MSKETAKIALDYSHNNKLTLEATSYSDFIQFLFTSGFKLGKIQAGFDSLEKLEQYNLIILSSPRNNTISETEIKIIEQYVKNGGSLLIISSTGGDYKNRTNLNELTQHFKFEFISDEINDSMNYVNLQKRPLFNKFKAHIITEHVNKIVLSSACSIKVYDYIEEENDISIDNILHSDLNAWHSVYNGKDWVEEDIPKKPLIVAVKYFKGRVVGFGSLSLFSSLSREYGFYAYDNDVLIGNILKWLIEKDTSERKIVTFSIDRDLYKWADKIVADDNWESMSDLFNVGIDNFRKNYKEIMNNLQLKREEKKEAYKKEQVQKQKIKKIHIEKEEEKEKKRLDLIPERSKDDLIDIMKDLEDITGEKYEYMTDIGIDTKKKEKKKNPKKK